MNRFLIIFILFVSLFYAHYAHTQHILRGKVVRQDYTPVKDATVYIDNYNPINSDENGLIVLKLNQEPTRPKTVKVEKKGFEFKTFNYKPTEIIPLEIIIDIPSRNVTGRISYKNGRTAINALVSVKGVPIKDSIFTDKLGYFKMVLPEGLDFSSTITRNLFVVNGIEIVKENMRATLSNNFVQIRLVEETPSTLFTVAIYDNKTRNKISGVKLFIDEESYIFDNQGFAKINKPNLPQSKFDIEGYKVTEKILTEKDNFLELYVEKDPNFLPPPSAIKNNKEKNKDESSTQSKPLVIKDTLKSILAPEISTILAEMETSRRLREEENKKIANVVDKMNYRINAETNLTVEQRNLLKKDVESLERTFIANDDAYRRDKEQMQALFSKLREAIIQQDSLSKRIETISIEKDSLAAQKKAIEEQKRQAEVGFRTKLIAISAVSVMLAVLLLVVYVFSNRINKQKKELEKTKLQLEEKILEIETKNYQLNKALEDLKKAQTQLVSSEKMASLGHLTAGIAHEINNPVNFTYAGAVSLRTDFNDLLQILEKYREITPDNINTALPLAKGLEQKLAYKEIKHEIDELLTSVKRGAERTSEIVKSLRTFARLDEDTLKKVDVEENLEATLTMLHNQYKGRIEIVKNYNKVPLVECFPGQLNQVFMNIIVNAIQAIKGEGKIYLTTSYPSIHANGKYKDKEAIEISIRDTGIGIPDEIKNNIFEPFFTTKDVGVGTGLGLSVSFGIVEKHKGEIKVFSEIGKGSEFVIILPVSSPNPLTIHNSSNQVSQIS
ncbi:MAG: ATP-binding protein [Thermoflexibacter sp.]|nr:ATP-binding protein [Thermoflexibacter sp.]